MDVWFPNPKETYEVSSILIKLNLAIAITVNEDGGSRTGAKRTIGTRLGIM